MFPKVTHYEFINNVRGCWIVAHFEDGSHSTVEGTRAASSEGCSEKTVSSVRKAGEKLAKFNKVSLKG